MAKPLQASAVKPAGKFSIARPLRHWYPVCRPGDLGKKPKAIKVFDTPLVVFRTDDGKVNTLLDRCAHRNVPLSIGKVVNQHIECAYHGWQFDQEGRCQRVPALCGTQEGKARQVPKYETRVHQGLVWVFMDPDHRPEHEPFSISTYDTKGYISVDYVGDFEATLHATLENILDVPHTAFLHRGLFRGTEQNRITAVVKRTPLGAEAEFLGEPRPAGVLGRVLAPGGGAVQHVDRFFLPSIAQVEYRLGNQHLLITNRLCPVTDFLTRMYATVSVKLPFGAKVLKPILMPFALKVLEQDKMMLRAQTERINTFGREQYASTAVDLLGGHILTLLKLSERNEKPVDELIEERIEMLA